MIRRAVPVKVNRTRLSVRPTRVCVVSGAEDDPIRKFRVATFGSDPSPHRVDLALLQNFMRWPADHWVTLSKNVDGHMEYFAHWIKDRAIGTWSLTGDGPAELACSVRPISSITAVNLSAEFYGVEGLDRRASRRAVIKFPVGDDITIDVRDWSGAGDHADAFIDHVLDAIAESESS